MNISNFQINFALRCAKQLSLEEEQKLFDSDISVVF